MGLGVLGSACAEALVKLGFSVSGWSRRGKSLQGVRAFQGPDAFEPFLSGLDVLVMLLPATRHTHNILGREALAHLPRGAAVINAGRGELIDDEALLEALDAGRLTRAVLDVFREEPLPPTHPFWANPRVTVTPHIASVTNPRTAAPVLVENLRRLDNGEPVSPIVDRDHGY
jgi:glyoxylate/hydroxypyruvate reductase A